jgi:rhamnosyltransferase
VVSVLLLTKNAGPRFEQVLISVFAQEGVQFEMVALDSGSTDGTLDLLRQSAARVHEIPSSAFSHGGTRNRIARLANGKLLAYLSQDACPVGTSWLADLAAAFDDPQVAGAFGRQLPRTGAGDCETYYQSYMYPSEPRRMVLEAGQRYRIADFFFSNANSMIRKAVWEQIPFPEHVIMSEDQWWAREVLRRGHALAYIPSAAVEHSHDHSPVTLFKRNFDSGASLRGLDETTPLESVARFVSYVGGELRYLSVLGKPHVIPAALGRELMRAAGMVAGANARFLPRKARSRLSMHRYHWT